jgi:hypothetical protein
MFVFIMLLILLAILKKKIKNFTLKYFGTIDLKEAIEKSELMDSNTPKSVCSIESFSLNTIKKDFPELNINELKSMVEQNILEVINSIEKKDVSLLSTKNAKIVTWVNSKIEDLKEEESVYDNIKIHKTAISKYEKNKAIATLEFQTSLEYFYKKGNNLGKKIQDRIKTELIYVIDDSNLSANVKAIGINCPNCGAPVTSLGNKNCAYCGTKVIDLVKRTWMINNINDK